jgi:polysaccharide pyruvyl transferase WcaK-like protein
MPVVQSPLSYLNTRVLNMPRVAVFGECYSENLGDAVILGTVEYLLRRILPGIEISSFDLSGRKQAQTTKKGSYGLIQHVNRNLRRRVPLYRRCINIVLWHLRDKKALSKTWSEAVAWADLCMLDGGQLLMDNDLNFPLKIHALAGLTKSRQKPVVFFGCGVGKRWSPIAKHLFANTLEIDEVSTIYVRDRYSYNHLIGHLPNVSHKVVASYDSALWAAEAYNISRITSSPTIGLGVTTPNVLKRYKRSINYDSILTFWEDIAVCLHQRGQAFQLFTNGALEDDLFALQVAGRVSAKLGMPQETLLAARPLSALDLVRQISNYKAVMAYRLHANIIAYALQIPSIGLIWDEKVRYFGEETNRSEFFLDADILAPAEIVDRLFFAAQKEIDQIRLQSMKETLLDDLRNALEPHFAPMPL